jgi:hypothetical protein
MAHFAKVLNGIVKNVIVAEQEFIDTYIDNEPGQWIQTSYNTRGGVHYKPNTIPLTPDGGVALRGNYAQIGGHYDAEHDVFYSQQPHPSWILNQTTWLWEAPVAYPNDGLHYRWDESTTSWIVVPPQSNNT